MAKRKRDEMVERWDLRAITMFETKDVQEALEEGYEPFSVTTLIKKPDSNLALSGKNEVVTETVIWFKRRNIVPLITPAATDNVTPLEPA